MTDGNSHRDSRPADIGAADGNRTHDLVLTKDALYRLSYSSLRRSRAHQASRLPGPQFFRVDFSLLRFVGCVTRLVSVCFFSHDSCREAGEGSRTLVSSLEGYRSTVELHPHHEMSNDEMQMTNANDIVRFHHSIRHLVIYHSFVIRISSFVFAMGSEGFEPSKALPSDLQSDPFDHSGNPPPDPNYFIPIEVSWPRHRGRSLCISRKRSEHFSHIEKLCLIQTDLHKNCLPPNSRGFLFQASGGI